jgi:hypothetical protein
MDLDRARAIGLDPTCHNVLRGLAGAEAPQQVYHTADSEKVIPFAGIGASFMEAR